MMTMNPFIITAQETGGFLVEMEAVDENELIQFKGSILSGAENQEQAEIEAQAFVEDLIEKDVHECLINCKLYWKE